MKQLFSARTRASTWRQLWLWLAEAEQELGLAISDEALDQLRAHVRITDDEFAAEAAVERRTRHDIMAHIEVYGQVASKAAGIIHWGATSCYCTGRLHSCFLCCAAELTGRQR